MAVAVSTAVASCSEDFVETKFYQQVEQGPLTSLTEVEAFQRGMYVSMRSSTYLGRDYTVYGEARSDEMYSNGYAGYFNTVYNYSMTSSDAYARDTWSQIYAAVAKANILINTDVNGITGTDADREAVRYHIGQAQVLRAMFFFDLLKLYGQKYTGGNLGIVTPLKYDPKALQGRGTIAENEAQIEADFNAGLALMVANDQGITDRGTLTINGAKALMSRYFLYKQNYQRVRTLTDEIVGSGQYQVVPTASYLGSWEAAKQNNSIFELVVGVSGANGTNSLGYIYNYDGYGNIVMSPGLFAQYTANDVRRQLIDLTDGEYYLYKYANLEGSDNLKVVRFEETILNGIEAELNGGSATKALAYYNQILTNRGLAADTSVTMAKLKVERAKELVGEGLRQWDLLRWGDAVPRPSNASADVRLTAFPIPRAETDIAGTPIVANPGYDN
ncbi:RagB/SusD family nutrient uptake outer membrane protein [Chryseobacterium sp.]|uniref:RagB/SusD family nutrient uptake outer membrane protein n=1 Tax=Chryseobacterium sp. TaxID=1871047 RepID=UPI00289781DD|nr:RagB/SusD family nutrient uptake outer membrane protein [Chryseobacterium sp.]